MQNRRIGLIDKDLNAILGGEDAKKRSHLCLAPSPRIAHGEEDVELAGLVTMGQSTEMSKGSDPFGMMNWRHFTATPRRVYE